MNSTDRKPRIRHLVEPMMSVVDRNLNVTNEVRTIMTAAAVPVPGARQGALETLVSKLAVRMLRWSSNRTNRARMSHERMLLILETDRAVEQAINASYVARIL